MIIRPSDIQIPPSQWRRAGFESDLRLAVHDVAKHLGGEANCTLSSMWRVILPGSEDGEWSERERTKEAFCQLVAEHFSANYP